MNVEAPVSTQKDQNPEAVMSGEPQKQEPSKSNKTTWYNKPGSLLLSLILWPAFVYGFFRSELFSRKVKAICVSLLAILVIVSLLITNHNEGLAYIRISKKSSPFKTAAFDACYAIIPKNNIDYCFHILYIAPNPEMAKALNNPELNKEYYRIINPSGDQRNAYHSNYIFDVVSHGLDDKSCWEPLSRYYSLVDGELYENGEKLTDYLEKNGQSHKIIAAVVQRSDGATPGENNTGGQTNLPKALHHNIEMAFVQGQTININTFPHDKCARFYVQRFENRNEIKINDFVIGKYPVTFGLWREVMADDTMKLYQYMSRLEGGMRQYFCDDCPIVNVNWLDVQVFIKKLNLITGKNYRLPSADEWEYVYVGGKLSKNFKYCGTDDVNNTSFRMGDSYVGMKKPNELGVYDLEKEFIVREYCSDHSAKQAVDIECTWDHLKRYTGDLWDSNNPYHTFRLASDDVTLQTTKEKVLSEFSFNNWKSYNHQYGYTIELPSQIHEDRLDDSGVQNYNTDELQGRISIQIQSSSVSGNKQEALQQQYDYALQNLNNVKYKSIGRDFFIISYREGDFVYYYKTIVGENMNTMSVGYSLSDTAIFNPLVSRISTSFITAK